ncbi:hypothetical protein H0H81_004873, partial [Sphagnurus paluster]
SSLSRSSTVPVGKDNGKQKEDSVEEIPDKILIQTARPAWEIKLPITLKSLHDNQAIEVKALLDSGATGIFIDKATVELNGIQTQPPDAETSDDAEEIYHAIKSTITSLEEEKERTAVELVPEHFHKYLNVFEKKASERMPLWKAWDHAIELKPDFVLKKAKVYPLSPDLELVADLLRHGHNLGAGVDDALHLLHCVNVHEN